MGLQERLEKLLSLSRQIVLPTQTESMMKPKRPIKRYHVGWDNGEEMQACHAAIIDVEEGIDPLEAAHRFLKDREDFYIIEFINKVKLGKKYPCF